MMELCLDISISCGTDKGLSSSTADMTVILYNKTPYALLYIANKPLDICMLQEYWLLP